MKIFRLHRQQVVPRPLHDVFEFFSRPENLALITPAWLGFRMITPSPIVMKKGAVIDYSIKVLGVRTRWQTLISEYEPLRVFVDQQSKGPYAFWHHTHTFTDDEAGTRIEDEIHYALPFRFLGRIAHTLVVRRQIEQIFSHRARVIEQMFVKQDTQREDQRANRERRTQA